MAPVVEGHCLRFFVLQKGDASMGTGVEIMLKNIGMTYKTNTNTDVTALTNTSRDRKPWQNKLTIYQLEKSLADEALLQSVGKDVEQIQALTTYEPNVVKRLVESIRVYPNERIEIQLRNQGLAQFFQTDKQQILSNQ